MAEELELEWSLRRSGSMSGKCGALLGLGRVRVTSISSLKSQAYTQLINQSRAHR